MLVAPGASLDADEVRFDDHVVLADALQVEGAAIRAEGNAVVDIRRSRFTNNRIEQAAPTGFARGAALAIAEADAPARVNLEDTAFEDNFATNVGGALFLRMGAAGITMQRLRFARNTADTGSAIDLNCSSSGTFVIENSTFADNGAPIPLAGSLVYVCAAQTLRLAFCSFAGNATPLVRLDTAAARVELRGNAIAAGSFELCTGLGAGTMLGGNVTDRDSAMCPLSVADQRQAPLLGTLSANEGLTATLPLLSGSPAIDAVMGACPAVDQRGKPRPVGAACDAGAFEAQ